MERIDRSNTYYLYCQTGFRSVVAASILKSRGFDVVDVKGGWEDMENISIAKTEYVCPTTLDQEVIDKAVSAVV